MNEDLFKSRAAFVHYEQLLGRYVRHNEIFSDAKTLQDARAAYMKSNVSRMS